MPIGSIIGAVGQTANTIGGTIFTAKQQKSAVHASRNWQRHVAKNKHSWEIESLKKAGLNPILAAGVQPNPGAGPPPAQVPDYSKIGEAGGKAASTAIEIMKAKKELEILANTAHNIREDTDLKTEQIYKTAAEKFNLHTQKRLLDYQLPGAEAEANIDASAYGRFMRGVDRLNPLTGSPLSRPVKGK